MKYYGKKTTALLLAALLTAGSSVPAFAQDSALQAPEKDEVIYANLDWSGNVQSVYVVNAYDLTEDTSITDYGDYQEVKNLTTTQELSVQDGSVSFTAPKGKFYYQGSLENVQLPWNVVVSYQLDGQPVDGSQLAGASGHLEMTLSFQQNPQANPVYFDNFAIQATVLLDSERCKNITAPDATMANVGSDKQMSYIVLPGKEKEFSIQADVTNFEMDGIQINGIPLTLSIDDPDTTEIKDKIYELKDGAVELDDGAGRLDDGATQLQDGVSQLKDGTNDLYDGVDELKDGVDELDEGGEKLRKGANDLKDGADTLAAGFDTLEESSRELKAGIAATQQQMAAALEAAGVPLELPSPPADPLDTSYLIQVGTILDKGFDQAIAFLQSQMGSGSSRELAALPNEEVALRVLSDYVVLEDSSKEDDADSGSSAPSDDKGSSSDEKEDSRTEGSSSSEGTETPEEPDSSSESKEPEDSSQSPSLPDNSLPEDSTSPSDQPAAQDPQEPTVSPLPEQPSHPSKSPVAASPLDSFEQQLASLKQYKQVNALCLGSLQYMAGTEKLSAGYHQLYDAILELRLGIQELVGGIQELTDGVDELFDGANDLRDGVDDLYDGTVELKDGTIELTDGTTELRDQSDDMDSKVDEEIDKMLEEYRGHDFEMVSFVSEKNTQVDSVQFVLKTAEIQVEEEDHFEIQEEPHLSFWEKLKNLFPFFKD